MITYDNNLIGDFAKALLVQLEQINGLVKVH